MKNNIHSNEKFIVINRYGLVERLNSLLYNLQGYYSIQSDDENKTETFRLKMRDKFNEINALNRTPEIFENDKLMQELIDKYAPVMRKIRNKYK